jgi:hypothetical protein
MRSKLWVAAALATANVIGYGAIAEARVVSFNVGQNMVAGDLAGSTAARDDNWNGIVQTTTDNAVQPAGTTLTWTGIVDGAGTSVPSMTSTLTYNNAQNFGTNNRTNTAGTNDTRMFSSYTDLFGGTAAAPAATVAVTNIPFAQYDVYVYNQPDDTDRVGAVKIGTRTEYVRMLPGGTIPANGGAYVESNHTTAPTSNADALNIPQGHFVRFEGVSGSTLSIDLWGDLANDSTPRIRLAGFQIVEVPEPAAGAVLGLAGLLLARRRRAN